MPTESNLASARRYLKAIEDGDANYVLSLFSPGTVLRLIAPKISGPGH